MARCAYCGGCDVALDDRSDLVFDPEGGDKPYVHLAWAEGRYSQWEKSPLGTTRVIGSVELPWDPPEPDPPERTDFGVISPFCGPRTP